MARLISGVGRVTVSERKSTSTLPTVRYNWVVDDEQRAGGREAARDGGEGIDGADELEELASVALEAARAGAAVLAAAVSAGTGGIDTKTSATDMVSDADRESEAAVSGVLAHRRPHDGVLGEEGTSRDGSTGVRWVVDPLDGTTNFLFGIPQYCVSVAAEVEGETAVGVVIDPCRNEIWRAIRGRGATRDRVPCRVAAGRSTLPTALVATGFGYRRERRQWQGAVAAKVLPEVRDLRRFGSAALDLCWTAGGRYDAYYEWGLNPWDLAAGALIAAEAGARVGILPGRLIVAATPELFEPLCDLLREAGGLEAPPGPEPAFW
jgi:fructose-1,6-bisphosphatase/inositol monophosphatase family enzyme